MASMRILREWILSYRIKGQTATVLLAVLWALAPSQGQAGELWFNFTHPKYQANGGADSLSCDPDSAELETSLARADVFAYRIPGNDTIQLGSIPATGKEGKRDSFLVAVADTVYYAGVFLYHYDHTGNRSCMSNQWLAAFTPTMRQPGLRARYYDDRELTTFFAERVDSMIDFDWDLAAPLPGMGVETFSIKWDGYLRVATGGTYTFEALVEDGFRAWIYDDFEDNWGIFNEHTRQWQVTLPPNADVPFMVHYTANNGTAVMRLKWIPPGQTVATVIPQERYWR